MFHYMKNIAKFCQEKLTNKGGTQPMDLPPQPSLNLILPDEIILLILERLSFKDRLNAEYVCRRWRYLAENKGWTKFEVFSKRDLERSGISSEAGLNIPVMKLLFSRCSDFLRELDLQHVAVGENIHSILFHDKDRAHSCVPNLVHLNTGSNLLSDLDLESIIPAHPRLRTALITKLRKSCTSGGLSTFFKHAVEANQLQHLSLEIYELMIDIDESLKCLPSSLKCLEFDGKPSRYQWLDKPPQLQSFVVDCWMQDVQLIRKVTSIRSLKHLAFNLNWRRDQPISDLFACLGNLKAVFIRSWIVQTEQELHLLTAECRELIHLSLEISTARRMSLACLAGMPKLRSVCIRILETQVFQLSTALPAMGKELLNGLAACQKLQYFHVNVSLPMDDVCNAFRMCKDLKTLSWNWDGKEYAQLFQTIETIKKKKSPEWKPGEQSYNVRYTHRKPPDHPWLLYHNDLPHNPILHELRYGGMEDQPWV